MARQNTGQNGIKVKHYSSIALRLAFSRPFVFSVLVTANQSFLPNCLAYLSTTSTIFIMHISTVVAIVCLAAGVAPSVAAPFIKHASFFCCIYGTDTVL